MSEFTPTDLPGTGRTGDQEVRHLLRGPRRSSRPSIVLPSAIVRSESDSRNFFDSTDVAQTDRLALLIRYLDAHERLTRNAVDANRLGLERQDKGRRPIQ
jgi:hypothetical protein